MKPFRKIYVEISNRCNLRCSFCPGTRRDGAFMAPVDFAREVGVGNDFRQFKMVGLFVMIAGGLLSLLLLVPNPGHGRVTILCIVLFVLTLGFTLYRLGIKAFRDKNR